jgi:hypothetical protein
MGEKFQFWKDLMGSEFEYTLKLGNAITDPDSKKEFWENIKRLKTED